MFSVDKKNTDYPHLVQQYIYGMVTILLVLNSTLCVITNVQVAKNVSATAVVPVNQQGPKRNKHTANNVPPKGGFVVDMRLLKKPYLIHYTVY